MRSVTRRKIWEGRCELGIEEHRTSGKREYVVGRQLRAFTTQVFRRRQISERFLSHVWIIHISIQVLIQTWTKKIYQEQRKWILVLQATSKDFARRLDIPQLTRQEELRAGLHALMRYQGNIDSIVITPAKSCLLNYICHFRINQRKLSVFQFQSPLSDSLVQLANSNIVKMDYRITTSLLSDLSFVVWEQFKSCAHYASQTMICVLDK